jgi:hypothetical protein
VKGVGGWGFMCDVQLIWDAPTWRFLRHRRQQHQQHTSTHIRAAAMATARAEMVMSGRVMTCEATATPMHVYAMGNNGFNRERKKSHHTARARMHNQS